MRSSTQKNSDFHDNIFRSSNKSKMLPLETKNTLQIENGNLGFIETLHKH